MRAFFTDLLFLLRHEILMEVQARYGAVFRICKYLQLLHLL